jgi:hypothetical protein
VVPWRRIKRAGASDQLVGADGPRIQPPPPMNDFVFVAASIAFFVLSAAYARFCEKVR